MDGSVPSGLSGRVANLDLMNFKLLLTTAGGAAFVSGSVFAAAGAICDSIALHSGKALKALASRPSDEKLQAASEVLGKQLDATTTRDAMSPTGSLDAPSVPMAADSVSDSPPEVGMGYCPGCGKLRHSSVARCVYCRDTRSVTDRKRIPPALKAQS
jgi:hypothetical protein